MTSTPTRPVDNVVITTKGLQDRNINILDGTTVENKGKLILKKIRGLTYTFWQSLTSFSIRRKFVSEFCDYSVKMPPSDSSLQYVHVHFSLLIEKDICDYWNVSVKLPCVYLCLTSGDLFIFLVRVASFYSYFCVICALVLSLSI